MEFSELAGGKAGEVAEGSGEIALVIEANATANIGDRIGSVEEEFFCVFDADKFKVSADGGVRFFLKKVSQA